MNQTWLIADLHFGDPRIAQQRGFSSTTAHDDHLVSMWNMLISPSDVVWVLGGVAGMSWTEGVLAPLGRCRGAKRLVCGEGDPVHPMHRGAWAPHLMEAAADHFEWVGTTAMVNLHGSTLLLNHFPYEGDAKGVKKWAHTQWRMHDEGVPLVHGHTHSTARYSLTRKCTPQLNVGADAWGFAPIHLEDVLLTLTSDGELP